MSNAFSQTHENLAWRSADRTTARLSGACQVGGMDRLEELFVAGDVDAFEILFRQYQGQVYAWIVRIVRNPATAEDLTVETFWRIYQYRKRFNPGRPFGPWARRIGTRLAIDYLRSAHRFSAEPCEPAAQPADPGLLLQRELKEQIERAFSLLPARLRVVATLALVEELPYSEIAEALGISLSAVKMRVARAVQTLRKSLERRGIKP